MKVKKVLSIMIITVASISAFGTTITLAAGTGVPVETVSVEMDFYDAGAGRELVDLVYFKSEAGKTVMSNTPFD